MGEHDARWVFTSQRKRRQHGEEGFLHDFRKGILTDIHCDKKGVHRAEMRSLISYVATLGTFLSFSRAPEVTKTSKKTQSSTFSLV